MLGNRSIADTVLAFLFREWDEYKHVVISALVSAMCTYLFIFTNKFPNYDDLKFLFGKGYTVTSGRWGLDLLAYILPNYSMPWFHGFISILLLTISIRLIIDIFSINNKTLQSLLTATIVSFPAEIGTMLYMFTSSSYAIAFLLAVVAVFMFEKKGICPKVLAGFCLILSCSIYQAYIAVTASFFVLLAIKRVLSSEGTLVEILTAGIGYILFLGISLLFYFALTVTFLHLSDSGLNDWAVRATSTSHSIIQRMYRSWILFVAVYLKKSFNLVPNTLSMAAHGAIWAVIGFMCICATLKEKHFLKILLLLVLLCIAFPLSTNCLVLLLGENGVHGLTLYSFISVYLLAIICFDRSAYVRLRNICKDILFFALSLVIICNIYTANKAYLKQYIIYENAVSVHQAVLTQLHMHKDFSPDIKVAIIGSSRETNDVIDAFGEDTIYGLGTYTGEDISEYFLSYYLGADLNYASNQEKLEISNDARVDTMAVYPYYGYIQKIDNFIVIKLGEN